MLIEKEDRLSRPTPPRRSSWQGDSRRRPPRNWQKTIRLAVYGLLGALAGVAALACVALLLDRGSSPPALPVQPPPSADQGVVAPAAPMAAVVPPPVIPVPSPTPSRAPLPAASPAQVVPSPTPSPAAPAPDSAELTALQAKIRDANAQLAKIQAQADQARQAAAAATRQREAAQVEAARQQASAAAAQNDDRRQQAAVAQAQRERDAADAEQRRKDAQQAQERADAAWAETERRIQTLAQQSSLQARAQPQPAPATAPPRPSGIAAAPSAPVAEPGPPSDADLAIVPSPGAVPQGLAAPAAPPPAVSTPDASPAATPRPRVFLHYLRGSAAALQSSTEIAQRLLFSDYAYADTRSAGNVPSAPTVRFFHPEDAAVAARLAALLAWTGREFQVQDDSAHDRGTPRGTLEVWIGR